MRPTHAEPDIAVFASPTDQVERHQQPLCELSDGDSFLPFPSSLSKNLARSGTCRTTECRHRTCVDVDLDMIKSRFWQARGAVIACFLLNMWACRPAASDTPAAVANDATTAIPAGLMASAEAWNNADLAGHIRPYTDSATFMGGNGPIQGRDRVGESLARSFWRDGKPKQQLSFDRIEVRPLGSGHALVDRAFRAHRRRRSRQERLVQPHVGEDGGRLADPARSFELTLVHSPQSTVHSPQSPVPGQRSKTGD